MSLIVMSFIKEALDDEKEHTEELASRILELGGTPLKSPSLWQKMVNRKYADPPI